MALATTRWDSAEHLKTEEDIRLYLEAICLEDPAALDETRLLHLLFMHWVSFKKIIARASQYEPVGQGYAD